MSNTQKLQPSSSPSLSAEKLRLEAEARFRSSGAVDPDALTAGDLKHLLHELQVHQIELELQNEELQRAQIELAVSRERYADLYDFAPSSYLTLSEKGMILEANLTAGTLLGLPRGDLKKWPLSRFIHPDSQNSYYLFHRQLLAGEAGLACRLTMRRWDERVFSAEIRADAGIDAVSGETVCRMLISDITESGRAQLWQGLAKEVLTILNSSEDLATSLLRIVDILKNGTGCAAVGIRLQKGEDFPYYAQGGLSKDFLAAENSLLVHDGQGNICRNAHGHPELRGTCGLVLAGKTLQDDNSLLPGGRLWSNGSIALLCPTAGQDPHGKPRTRCAHDGYASVALVPIRAQQKIIGLLQFNDHGEDRFAPSLVSALEGIARQIGEAVLRSQAEIRLRESEERHREYITNTPYGVMVCDQQDKLLQVNPAACRISGYTEGELLAMSTPDLLFQEAESEGMAPFQSLFTEGKSQFESIFRHKNGKKCWWSMTSVRISGNRFLHFFNDISDKKKAEEERKELEQHLLHAQKMEAIGTLAGGIAHDFNNILGAVLGYAEMARESSIEGTTMASDLDEVITAGNRAKDLVRQILAFSRQHAVQRTVLQPTPLIQEAIALLRPSLPATIAIKLDVDLHCRPVDADPTQMNQIIMNLCTNAFHAMEERGGTLTITLKNVILNEDDLLGEPGINPGNFVKLQIADTGSGIAPEIRSKIYEPYFTTKEVGKGTGLGLATTHGIVKGWGGFITCDSRLGEGTVFSVNLPAIEATRLPEGIEEQVPSLGGCEHILFVDDEPILCKMQTKQLERHGYRVTAQENSREALALFSKEPTAFDLVITDQTMPDLTGFDMAVEMLRIRPDLPIILCTGYSSIVSEEKAKAAGIRGFAEKPVLGNVLAHLIREVLDDK